jgi:uncharacterized membrane protein
VDDAGAEDDAGQAARRVSQRAVRARPSRGGLVVGLLFFCTSLTPSLLPRTWLAQSLISTITTSGGVRDRGNARLGVHPGGAAAMVPAAGRAAAPWSYPRVVYLQNATDPVTWWSPQLLWRQPDWLREPPGRDILPAMRWYPVVTFLQVTADLALAYGAPPGHGHRFHTAAVAWAAIDAPPGWTAWDTGRLTALLGP